MKCQILSKIYGPVQKTAEVTYSLIGNKIVDKITSTGSESNPDTLSQTDEIPKERYIFPEKREQVIDELRFI